MALSIDNLRMNLGQPAQTFTWNVKIANLPGGVGDTETLMLRCQSTQMPSRMMGEMSISYKQGPKLQFPGKLEYSHDWKCTFIEGEDNAILNTFYAWAQQQVDDVSNLGGAEANVKTDIYLTLTRRADDSEYRVYKLKGCWVKEIGSVELSNETSDIVKIPVTFKYDSWELVK
jgi:hypothetical protein